MRPSDISNGTQGQIFSLDVLLSLLPIMMILGSSLQYLFLSEEEMRAIDRGNELEGIVNSFSECVMAGVRAGGSLPQWGSCQDFANVVDDCGGKVLPSGYVYYVRARGLWDGSPVCDKSRLWSIPDDKAQYALEIYNTTSASEERYLLLSDGTGSVERGKIVALSFTVWEDIK